MTSKIDNLWAEYQADVLTDPQYRYSHDHKDIFTAGYNAGQRKETALTRESVWISAPVAEDDDPE